MQRRDHQTQKGRQRKGVGVAEEKASIPKQPRACRMKERGDSGASSKGSLMGSGFREQPFDKQRLFGCSEEKHGEEQSVEASVVINEWVQVGLSLDLDLKI